MPLLAYIARADATGERKVLLHRDRVLHLGSTRRTPGCTIGRQPTESMRSSSRTPAPISRWQTTIRGYSLTRLYPGDIADPGSQLALYTVLAWTTGQVLADRRR